MPKYIKDGAYTIVVDERSLSTKKSASTRKSGSESSSEDGSDHDHEDGFQSLQNDDLFESLPPEELVEEDIDYTSPTFILQNLKLAVPDLKEDKTMLLSGRQDLAEIICSQVRYFCYCALDAFSRHPRATTILVIGEGFLGSKIINNLVANGCKDMLRVCTRGDLTAKEWCSRGIKADNSLTKLMQDTRPDIIIITVENSSFSAICRQLMANFLVSATTFVISCSFGFQRRKLYTQLKCPTIFRTFVEPEEIYAQYKKRAADIISSLSKKLHYFEGVNVTSKMESTTGKFSAIEDGAPVLNDEISLVTQGSPSLQSATTDIADSSKISEQKAAEYFLKRTKNLINLIHQLENYYAVNHHGFAESRQKAIKNVLGHVYDDPSVVKFLSHVQLAGIQNARKLSSSDISFEAMSLKKAMRAENKCRTKLENCLKKLMTCKNTIEIYCKYFLDNFPQHTLEELKSVRFTAEQNNPKSGPNMVAEVSKHNTSPSKGMGNTVADLPGRQMHDENTILKIFLCDDDYSSFAGPGFDLMREWDDKDRKTNKRSDGMNMSTGGDSPSVMSLASRQSSPEKGQREHRDMSPQFNNVAAKELAEYGKRISSHLDGETSKIDRNYLQQYLEHSSANR